MGYVEQFLPTGGFQWVYNPVNTFHSKQNMDEVIKYWRREILSLDDEANIGLMLEVDLEYPNELHDLHDTYPLAPEHVNIKNDMLYNYQQKLAKELGVKVGGDKLCLTLKDKKRYICHYRNLKQYLQLGLKLIKVHRVLKFNQSPWLKPYIDLNTRFRQQALSKFEYDFAKLMNNSFFGKTCEDVRKYKDIRIVIDGKKAQKLINKPTYNRSKRYNENMAAIQLIKQVVNLNKPRYIGMTILNLSKIIMYDFHYNFILTTFPGKKLLFTDTDSFCYEIQTNKNIPEEFKRSGLIDFSNYPTDSKYYDESKKLVPGFFKDETAGVPIIEFVGLRSKMYSLLKVDGNTKKTCKGVNKVVKDEIIKHKHFKEALEENRIRYDKITKIIHENHELYTAETSKCSLSPFNDKKYITRENGQLMSLSFGHYLLRGGLE